MSLPILKLQGVSKSFVLHNQGAATLPVLQNVELTVEAGECVVLDGPSGMGKSTLLKLIYANYKASSGQIWIIGGDPNAHSPLIDMTQATSRELLQIRRDTIGYVSQFLRVIPRVSALDVVAEPLVDSAASDSHKIKQAREQASELLRRLRIPERLWHLPPATFSGGEQQRINIARGLIKRRPLMLLDEPTASLDQGNSETVVELIKEARDQGSAIIGIFHDAHVGEQVATRRINVGEFRGIV